MTLRDRFRKFWHDPWFNESTLRAEQDDLDFLLNGRWLDCEATTFMRAIHRNYTDDRAEQLMEEVARYYGTSSP